MIIEIKYIGSRVSVEIEVDGVLKSLYQNVWTTIDANEKKLLEIFNYEKAFEIKPFSYVVRKKVTQKLKTKFEIGWDGVQFYKRKLGYKNPVKLPLNSDDFNDNEILTFVPASEHRSKVLTGFLKDKKI